MKLDRNIKSAIRRVNASVKDELELLLGKRDKLTPPRRLIDGVGGGNFKGIGEEFFRHFLEVGKLKPDEQVLDVGCGCGRMAVPLTRYLSAKGGYWGFDIVKENITWCRKYIEAGHPNFHFEPSDVFNKHYHPKGRFKAAEYRFPHPDGFFDFVSLTSVFTHMLAADMLNYLNEISRVLKPGGRSFISFFLLNEESRRLISERQSKVAFPHPGDRCMYSREDNPEAAIGFEESFIREQHAARRLKIVEPVFYGSWAGRQPILTYQDVVLAVKR